MTTRANSASAFSTATVVLGCARTQKAASFASRRSISASGRFRDHSMKSLAARNHWARAGNEESAYNRHPLRPKHGYARERVLRPGGLKLTRALLNGMP